MTRNRRLKFSILGIVYTKYHTWEIVVKSKILSLMLENRSFKLERYKNTNKDYTARKNYSYRGNYKVNLYLL